MKKWNFIVWFIFLYFGTIFGVPFSDNGNGIVKDSGTGLLWQKCSAGQGTTLGNCSTGTAVTNNWTNALIYCEGLTLGGRNDWRIPNINEIRSLLDLSKSSGTFIDIIYFPNTQPFGYWSSSTFNQNTVNAYYIYFDAVSGGLFHGPKSNNLFMRCVTGP
jgi:hypothetical protein